VSGLSIGRNEEKVSIRVLSDNGGRRLREVKDLLSLLRLQVRVGAKVLVGM
jgi:hypothetical protein